MSFNESNTVEQMILDAISADTTGGNRPFEFKDAPGWGAVAHPASKTPPIKQATAPRK